MNKLKFVDNNGNPVRRKRNESALEFMNKRFKSYNDKYQTVNEKGEVVCQPGKHRSIQSVRKIMSYYFPGITNQKIDEDIKNLERFGKINVRRCGAINKDVIDYV